MCNEIEKVVSLYDKEEDAILALERRYSLDYEATKAADVNGTTPFGFVAKKFTDNGKSMLNGEIKRFSSDGKYFFLDISFLSKQASRVIELFELTEEGPVSLGRREINTDVRQVHWHPRQASKLIFLKGRTLNTYDVLTRKSNLLKQFDKDISSGYKAAGGDGNDICHLTGDLLLGPKNGNMFVYNILTGKEHQTFKSHQDVDYAQAFNGTIVIITNGDGTWVYSLDGDKLLKITRRGGHAEFLKLKDGRTAMPFTPNEKDSREMVGDLEAFRKYFAVWNKEGTNIEYIPQDKWPHSSPGGSHGGQYSATDDRVFIALAGPGLYERPWASRTGEVYEMVPRDPRPRRIARHGIGVNSKYSTNEQPECFASPDNKFLFYKNIEGWSYVELEERAPASVLDEYISTGILPDHDCNTGVINEPIDTPANPDPSIPVTGGTPLNPDQQAILDLKIDSQYFHVKIKSLTSKVEELFAELEKIKEYLRNI